MSNTTETIRADFVRISSGFNTQITGKLYLNNISLNDVVENAPPDLDTLRELAERVESAASSISYPISVANGGTGAITAPLARTALGLAIGTDVQAYNSTLAAVAAGTALAVANGGTGATNAGAARTALGLAIGTDVQAYNSTLDAVAGATYAGAASITTVGTIGAGTWNGTAIAVANGGTGATTEGAARSALGLAIGTDVQAYNSNLAAVAGGTYTGDDSITTVGTIGTGTWNGSTIAVANGGTGATTEGAARSALGLTIGTDVQAYNTTLAAVAGGTYAGDDSITTVGTIGTGSWNGSTIGQGFGGTGQTTYTAGDILYANGAGNLVKLSPGSVGQVLTINQNGLPAWAAPTPPV